MIWKGCVLINVRVESYERFDWLMGLWGKFAMSTEKFSGLILITGSRFENPLLKIGTYANEAIETASKLFVKDVTHFMFGWLPFLEINTAVCL